MFRWIDGSPLINYAEWSKSDFHHHLPTVFKRENVPSNLGNRSHWDHVMHFHMEPRRSTDNCVAAILTPISGVLQWITVPCDKQFNTRFVCHLPSEESSSARAQPALVFSCTGKAIVINHVCVKVFPVLPKSMPHDVICTDMNMTLAEQDPLLEKLRNTTEMVSSAVCRFTIPKSQCPASTFMCDDLSCIPLGKLCNNMTDCWTGEDEADCEHMICSTGVGCTNTTCRWPQCTCNGGYFQCEHGGCVSADSICDGQKNCGDGSDEAFCVHALCSPHQMLCADGKMCVDELQWFDGIDDCLDRSDELPQQLCLGFMCHDGHCIPTTRQNDGVPDCTDAEDETRYIYDTSGGPTQWPCETGYIPCINTVHRCYLASNKCIYDTDALGNMYSCRRADHLLDCAQLQCDGMFKCPSSYCVQNSRVCDGTIDCQDGADEADCPMLVCPYMFRCTQEQVCISAAHVCDGKVHCRMSADDERFCLPAVCQPNECVIEQGILDFSNMGTHVHLIEVRNSSIMSIRSLSRTRFFATVSLDISYNYLSHLPALVFDKHTHLSYLYLRGNRLKVIGPLVFKGIEHLQVLDLADNELSFVSGNQFTYLYSISKLDLSGNFVFVYSSFVDKVMIIDSVVHSDSRVCYMVAESTKCIIVGDNQDTVECSELQYRTIIVVCVFVAVVLVLVPTIWSLVLLFGDKKKVVVTCLAISDGLFAFHLTAVGVKHFIYADGKYVFEWQGSAPCILGSLLFSLSSQVSLLTLMLLALNACFITIWPFQHRTIFKSTKFSLAAIWILSTAHQLWPVVHLYYTEQVIQADTGACFHIHGNFGTVLLQLALTSLFFLLFCFISLMTIVLLKRSVGVLPTSSNTQRLKTRMIWNTVCLVIHNAALHYMPLIVIYSLQVISIQMPRVAMLAFVLITLPLNKILNALIYNILKSLRGCIPSNTQQSLKNEVS